MEEVDPTSPSSDIPQKILIISDEHRGAHYSNMRAYAKSLMALLPHYNHIVWLGDDAEFIHVRKDFVQDYAVLLEALTNIPAATWAHKLNAKGPSPSDRVRASIYAETTFMDELLNHFPKTHIHKLLGNHENIAHFRAQLIELEKTHANFEWSPEAIRIGDGLFTHGHLPIAQQNDVQYPVFHLKDIEKIPGWYEHLYNTLQMPGQSVAEWLRAPEKAVQMVDTQLRLWAEEGGFHYRTHNSAPTPLTMDWVKHVFFGHTHVKFNGFVQGGIAYHNTGALVHSASRNPAKLGILEAELHTNGTIDHVHPLSLIPEQAKGAYR